MIEEVKKQIQRLLLNISILYDKIECTSPYKYVEEDFRDYCLHYFSELYYIIDLDKITEQEALELGFVKYHIQEKNIDIYLMPRWLLLIIPQDYIIVDIEGNYLHYRYNQMKDERYVGTDCIKYGIKINEIN